MHYNKKWRPDTGSRRKNLISLSLGILLLQSSVAFSQWQVLPSISAGYEYDDNASLLTGSTAETSVNGYLIEADARATYTTPRNYFLITPRVLVRRYNQLSSLDSEDYFLNLDYRHTAQRSAFRLRGTFGDESTRTAERSDVDFDVENPDDIPVDDSGRVLATEDRQRIRLAPQWSYEAGERTLLRLGANYIDVSYDDQISQLYTDYTETSGQASFEWKWSETGAVALDGYYRENYFDVSDRAYSGYGITAGVKRSLTEKTQFVFAVGMDATENEEGDKENNVVGEISLTRTLELSRILASYRRTVTGNGAGELALRDSVNLSISHDVSEKLTLGAGLSAYQTSALSGEGAGFDSRDWLQLRALLSWRLTRAFVVDIDYSHTNLNRESLPSSADSNRVNVWLRYRPQN